MQQITFLLHPPPFVVPFLSVHPTCTAGPGSLAGFCPPFPPLNSARDDGYCTCGHCSQFPSLLCLPLLLHSHCCICYPCLYSSHRMLTSRLNIATARTQWSSCFACDSNDSAGRAIDRSQLFRTPSWTATLCVLYSTTRVNGPAWIRNADVLPAMPSPLNCETASLEGLEPSISTGSLLRNLPCSPRWVGRPLRRCDIATRPRAAPACLLPTLKCNVADTSGYHREDPGEL